MRFCSLASCSTSGNAYYVEGADGTRILVDCGLPLRRLETGLRALGTEPSDLAAILITHEHGDHIRSLQLKKPFALRHGVKVYAAAGFWRVVGAQTSGPASLAMAGLTRTVFPGQWFAVGGLTILPFAKPHDAAEPVGYLVSDGLHRLGVVTDLGAVGPDLVELLRGADYLIFESNHDPELERRSGRPWPLIRRVLSDHGHLSNDQAGQALAAIVTSATRLVLLAHLSDECNRPELALSTVGRWLADVGYQGRLVAASLHTPSPLFGAEEDHGDRPDEKEKPVPRRGAGLSLGSQ